MQLLLNWMLSRRILLVRSGVFVAALLLALVGKDLGVWVFTGELAGGLKLYHLLWGFVMLEMVLVLIPGLNHFNGCAKVYKRNYQPKTYDRDALMVYTRRSNQRAIGAALVWLAALILVGVWVTDPYWIVMIAILFYFLDQLFVNVWCPFQQWILKNRCCVTCRIHNWGFPIMVSPLLFIPSFWTYSLVAVGGVILVQWEVLHARHPERFSSLSNAVLACRQCNDPCRQMRQERP